MIKTITSGLMGSIFPTPYWAPPGGGGGGSIPDDEGDEGQGNESDDDEGEEFTDDDMRERPRKKKDGESDDDDGISLESKDFLEQFWDEDEDDEDEDEDDDAGDSEESQKALGNELKAMIEGLTIPEDMIPEDFDPSDPKQFRDVVGKIQRQSVALALKAVFKPMAAALNQQTHRMRKEYQAYVETHSTGNSIRSRLVESIPAAADKKHRQIVGMVLKQASQKFPKDTENQLRSARKALAALGITKDTRTNTGTGRRTSDGNDFSSVLDSFAPMPRKPEGRATGRLRSR